MHGSIREAVANVHTHAGARRSRSWCRVANGSVLGRVADDGGWFEVAALVPAGPAEAV